MKHPFDDYLNSEIRGLIDEVIHSERDRELMKRKLCDDIYFEPLAEEFNISVQQAKSIYARCMEKLARRKNIL